MSTLLGPLSETISSVSWRACARAGDQIAGNGTALPAARAVIIFRNSRRFMAISRRKRMPRRASAKVVPIAGALAKKLSLGVVHARNSRAIASLCSKVQHLPNNRANAFIEAGAIPSGVSGIAWHVHC